MNLDFGRCVIAGGWWAMLVLLTTLTLARRADSQRDQSISMLNHLLEEDQSLDECSTALERVRHLERRTFAPYPPDIKGSWVSQQYISFHYYSYSYYCYYFSYSIISMKVNRFLLLLYGFDRL